MRIQKLTAFHVRIPLKKVIRHASHTRSENETIIVRCELDNGMVGWGEGLPRPYVTGETIDTVWDQWITTEWQKQLASEWDSWNELFPLIQKMELSIPENIAAPASNSRDCFGNSLRCAVELSLLDAAARTFEKPLSTITTHFDPAAAICKARDYAHYGVALTSMSSRKQIINSILYRLFGFQHVKVKVGAAEIDDERLLKRIRKWMGNNVDLRIDANEAWHTTELSTKIAPLTKFNISSVEQPIPHAELNQLAEIATTLDIPIMLDESLCSVSDARFAITNKLCSLFNIRLSKCGGFLNSLEIAALANNAGLEYQLGCMVGETGILSAAGRHFACSVANIKHLEGSFDRYLVKERLTKQDITFGLGGKAPSLTSPGLGVDVDETAIARTTVKQQDWG